LSARDRRRIGGDGLQSSTAFLLRESEHRPRSRTRVRGAEGQASPWCSSGSNRVDRAGAAPRSSGSMSATAPATARPASAVPALFGGLRHGHGHRGRCSRPRPSDLRRLRLRPASVRAARLRHADHRRPGGRCRALGRIVDGDAVRAGRQRQASATPLRGGYRIGGYHTSEFPPSTTMTCPVTYALRSNPSTASAQSWGRPDRCSGTAAATAAC
jgi:hypothetical protein